MMNHPWVLSSGHSIDGTTLTKIKKIALVLGKPAECPLTNVSRANVARFPNFVVFGIIPFYGKSQRLQLPPSNDEVLDSM